MDIAGKIVLPPAHTPYEIEFGRDEPGSDNRIAIRFGDDFLISTSPSTARIQFHTESSTSIYINASIEYEVTFKDEDGNTSSEHLMTEGPVMIQCFQMTSETQGSGANQSEFCQSQRLLISSNPP